MYFLSYGLLIFFLNTVLIEHRVKIVPFIDSVLYSIKKIHSLFLIDLFLSSPKSGIFMHIFILFKFKKFFYLILNPDDTFPSIELAFNVNTGNSENVSL